jgi:hypothetical protein
MMQLNESTREKLMIAHGCSMVALGLALFYVRATMTNLFFYVFGGAFALLLVAASLLFIAGVDWICATGPGCRQVSRLRGFLFLSTAVALCSLLLIFYPGATMQMLCYLLAVYALSLSIGKFGFARSWNGSKREQAVMYILAGVALAFSGALVGFAAEDDRVSFGRSCQLLFVHGLADAAHDVLLATAAAQTNRACFAAQPGERVTAGAFVLPPER